MKLIVSTTAAFLMATSSFAGNLVFEAPEEQEIIVAEPAPAGGINLAWLIPVIGLAAVAVAVANDDDDDDT